MRDIGANGALLRDLAAERDAALDAAAHGFEGSLGLTDQSHAVMNAAGAQAALRDLEAAAFAQQHVGGGDAHIGKGHFGVAVRGVIVAEDGEHAIDFDAGRIERH